MLQKFALAIGYNAVAIPLAAGVATPLGIALSLTIGAAIMSLSTVLVMIYGKKLARASSATTNRA